MVPNEMDTGMGMELQLLQATHITSTFSTIIVSTLCQHYPTISHHSIMTEYQYTFF
jgi:hypothetical protein